MGMFDSFLIDHAGKTHEVQTKRFVNLLNFYRPGDLVDGAPPGVRVYFIRMQWNAQGRLVYTDEAGNQPVTFFIVLVNAIFTASEVLEAQLDDAAIRQHLDDLKTRWSDTAHCMARWGEFLAARQEENALLGSRIAVAKRLIDYAQKPEEEKAQRRRFPLFREEEKRLDQGENVLDILREILDSDTDGRLWSQAPRIADGLDDYRL
jgi:hypothetical protein